MISLDRDRRDEAGQPIRPDQGWFSAAAEARKTALREAGAHKAREGVYGDDQVKAALEALFHDKCAYCETKIVAGSDWDVEHFRPKGKVAERKDHPGYYWLAYEWSNLYPSCSYCNQRRKDRPRWGDLQYAGTGGKLDQFPLEDEASRSFSPDDDLAVEKRLLLDPCADRPEEQLRYTVDGQVVALAGSRKAEVSIDVFHLKRRRLREQRRNKVEAAVALLKLIRKQEKEGKSEAARDLKAYLDRFFLADSCEYAATARLQPAQARDLRVAHSGLVAAHRATGRPVIASAYGGSFGVPALFSRALFAELARLEGGDGAKQVIQRYASEACFLPFRGGEVDVDTPDDVSRLMATMATDVGP